MRRQRAGERREGDFASAFRKIPHPPTMMNDQEYFLGHHHHSSTGPGATVLQAMDQIDTHIEAQQPAAPSTLDLFDSVAPSSPSRQSGAETTLINATNATVAITTTSTAPSIAGLGKITPSANPSTSKPQQKKRILVPTYSVNGGLDIKFNSNPRDARPSHLHNLLPPEEYEAVINVINDNLKKFRNGKIDKACLVTGPLMIPLAVWGVRHNKKVKKSRMEIERSVEEFNDRMDSEGRNVRMFWNRVRSGGGGESYLSIEEVDANYGGKSHKVD